MTAGWWFLRGGRGQPDLSVSTQPGSAVAVLSVSRAHIMPGQVYQTRPEEIFFGLLIKQLASHSRGKDLFYFIISAHYACKDQTVLSWYILVSFVLIIVERITRARLESCQCETREILFFNDIQ